MVERCASYWRSSSPKPVSRSSQGAEVEHTSCECPIDRSGALPSLVLFQLLFFLFCSVYFSWFDSMLWFFGVYVFVLASSTGLLDEWAVM